MTIKEKAEKSFKDSTNMIPYPTSYWVESKDLQEISFIKGYTQCLTDSKDNHFTIKDIEDAFEEGERLGKLFKAQYKDVYLAAVARRKIKII